MFAMLVAMTIEVATPSQEALALGQKLATTGTLATLAPMMAEQDIADLAKEDPTLTPAQRSRLIELGRADANAGFEKLTGAMGAAYAKHLSVEDLRTLVAQAGSPAVAHLRAIQPAAIREAVLAIGQLDLKKRVAADFCKETGKMCGRK